MYQVLVVVLNHNKKEMVLACLNSLESQTYSACQVVVFDNASTDGSQSAIGARFPQVDLVCSDKNLGAIEGRNAAVSYGRQRYEFDVVLFLDDDAEIARDSMQVLVDALMSDPAIGIACGKTYTDSDSNVIMSAGVTVRLWLANCYDRGSGEPDFGDFDADCDVDACGAFALMIKAAVFELVEGFDAVFSPYGWEDVDLCLRANALGYRTRYVHDAVFVHKGTRVGRGPVPRYERSKSRNFIILLRRHTIVWEKMSAAIFVPLRGLFLVARFAWRGNWCAIAELAYGVLDFLGRSRGKHV